MVDSFPRRELSFLIQIEGGNGATNRGKDVVVEYQLGGSSSFNLLHRMPYYGDHTQAVQCDHLYVNDTCV